MITIHTASDLNKLRENGRIIALIHRELKNFIQPGITTMDIEKMAEELIYSEGAIPGFRGYKGYKFCTCISIDDEIVHGLPDNNRVLKDGALVSVDVGTYKENFFGDAAFTVGVGKISREKNDLIEATENALNAAISVVRDGVTTGTIGRVIEEYSSNLGYSVVKNYVGHAIGKNLHENPSIYNYGRDIDGPKLKAGCCICIEPMLCIGSSDNHRLSDGWTVVTNDNSLSAHAEHQIIIHKDYAETITV
jgi:methionyl aminopeptidase